MGDGRCVDSVTRVKYMKSLGTARRHQEEESIMISWDTMRVRWLDLLYGGRIKC